MNLTRLLSFVLLLVPVQQWRYRQRITTAPGVPVTRVTVDRAVYDGAAVGLEDLRVMRDGSVEVPYLLTVANASEGTKEFPVRVVNQEWRAGSLAATLELPGREPHNELRLNVTRLDFRSRVLVEASEDGRGWATVRQAAYIFRYRADDGQVVEHTTLHYPDSRRRYLRVTLSDWPDPAGLGGATVFFNHAAEARRSPIWSGDQWATTASGCMVFDTGTTAPRDRAGLTPTAGGPPVFHRSVSIEESADGKSWSWLGAGAIYRIRGEESLAVDFPETRSRWHRLCIFQGNDQPVRLSRVQLSGVDRVVSFRSQEPGAYWLYYGAPSAPAPVYDLARTAGEEFTSAAGAGALSAREANPAYRAPAAPARPWTERYPALLYAVMGVAVGGLGWMALRLLRA
jgi:hypothetical protein